MKLNEIKKLSRKKFAERYPFIQVRGIHGDLAFYDEDILYSKEVDSEGEGFSERMDIHKGDPNLEFYVDDFGGWTDILLCWAEKVKPYYDKMPADMKENFYILDLKEKYGDMRLYLSGYPTGEFEKIKEYTDMVEHLSMFTCLQCGHISRASRADKLLTWGTSGWISYYCKDCAKKYLRRDNKEYGVKMSKEKFKQVFNDTFKKIEGDWFARFVTYNGDKKECISYDCRELLEGMF